MFRDLKANEIWKDIIGYEGLYKVSNLGRVKNCATNKILKIQQQRYAIVFLYKNSNRKAYKLHRLVAKAFLPNPDNKPEVNHINGNKSDNRTKNLEWCTRNENMKHASIHQLINFKNANNKTKKPVLAIKVGTNNIDTYESLSEAGRSLGIDVSNICNCCKGKINSIGGYEFTYGNI